MWMSILSFIGGPVVKGLIDAYQAKLKAGNVSERIAPACDRLIGRFSAH